MQPQEFTPPVVGALNRATRKNVRGSTLLTIGRVLAVGVNFLTHVLIVRYLAQADYGALAFALSAVSMGSSVAVFGMNKTMARFLPIYEERGQYDQLFGGLALGLGIMLALSLSMVLLFYGLRGALDQFLIESDLALAVLTIKILMVPIQTFDSALIGLFAIFANARLIFWRRHVVTPLLGLGAVFLVIWIRGDVIFLAVASVVVGSVGMLIYGVVLVGVLRRRGLFAHLHLRRVRVPAREMLGFSLPLLSTDVVFILRGSLLVILLGSLSGSMEVALFGAVAPIANQNMLVLDSFRLLFMPAAARLYARDDGRGIDDLYWQTAVWVAIFTLPILLISVSLAAPLAVFLFGDEYRNSGTVLAILAIGYYVNAAFGFNGLTLRVFGRVRYLVTVDVATAIIGVAAAVPLIMMFGAVGAAAGVTLILVAQNTLYQLGLRQGTSVSAFAKRYLRVYLGIPVAAAIPLLIQAFSDPPLWFGVGIAAVVALAFFVINREFLRIGEMFPELARIPFIRWLIG
ncbi:MAG: oligosaccharide flippase family protein [Chloroflexota bacterium]|nr:oligosaccharide flippase family protein [Chloroflexota bacterium]